MPIPAVVQPSAEPQTLAEILDWHRGIVDAIVEQRTSIRTAIRRGLPVADPDEVFDRANKLLQAIPA